ncbi:MAG TPA: 2-dehydropantoate 2-reductase [Alphaproteobacteria bacterium]|nr:2-dehydropantoate 2-reductase [Alphaproteobacteria bacterium]
MRFIVYGAGGLGGSFGARLAAAGDDVGFLARGGHLAAIRSQGLAVYEGGGETHLYRLQASDDPAALAPADIVLLCVKMYDLVAVLPRLPALLCPDGAVLTVQNGIEAPQLVAEAVGRPRVIAGAVYLNAGLERPGVIRVRGAMRGKPAIEFGELHAGRSARVEALAERLNRAGIDAAPAADTDAMLWQKFCLVSATSAATALARRPIGELREDAESRWLIEQAVAETAALARARGVRLDADAEARVLALIDSMPTDGKASQLLDLEAGKPLELDWLSGAIRRLGREAGVATPLHRAAYAALKPWRHGPPAHPPEG